MVNTWKIIGASLLIFAAGVMTGAFSVGIAGGVSKRKSPEKQVRLEHVSPAIPALAATVLAGPELPKPIPAAPGMARLEVFRKLDRAMNLNSAQRERIGQVVDETEKRLHELWGPIAPEAQKALLNLRKQIEEEILTPEQRPAFEKFLKSRSTSERNSSRKSQPEPNRN